jgi:hypothetical protein
MFISIKRPELFTITESDNKTYFGGDQEWYIESWPRKAGCGPVCASNITSYLAHTRNQYKSLYTVDSMEKCDFLKHMDELFRYITPGHMGVNTLKKFYDGFKNFVSDKQIELDMYTFSVDDISSKNRNLEELALFVEKALSNDTPLAFLNLCNGNEERLQSWHWITITAADIKKDSIIAVASDEGKKIEFDLSLWYLTTKMHGGFIYFI